MDMADGTSFVGIRVGGKVLTNGQAFKYLDKVFARNAEAAGLVVDTNAFFMSESEAKERGLDARAGGGDTMSDFDISRGLDHRVRRLWVVGHDEFFDESKADEPADAWHFLCTLTAIDHEFRHVYQHTVLEKNGSELGRLLFLNQWGLYGSQRFYGETYERDVNEIDAQYLALKKLGMHVSRMKDFELVDVDRVDKGFEVGGRNKEHTRRTPADTAVCFYQAKRGKDVGCDFIENPEGGYRLAKTVFKNLHDGFLNAVYGGRAWSKDKSVESCRYEDIDDYVKNGGDERLSAGFRANPKVLEKFKAEKDGFKQMLIMAVISTAGFGNKSLQDVLHKRIREIFDTDVSAPVVLRESVEQRKKALPARFGVGGKIARRALKDMASDVEAKLQEPDIEFDEPGG